MLAVENYKICLALEEEATRQNELIASILTELSKLRARSHNISDELYARRHGTVSGTDASKRRQFIKACSAKDCRGFLSTQWKCGICEKTTCSKCFILKDDDEESKNTGSCL